MDLSVRRKTLKACTGRNSFKKNSISELPDDILICLVSLLTMKEAGRTSVLSKRWRHVWAYVRALNFDASKILDELKIGHFPSKKEETKYIRWVDQVVSSHKTPIIDEFRVRFTLQKRRKDNINSWVRFAVEKGVKRFELNAAPTGRFHGFNSYAFPSLSFSSTLNSLQLAHVEVTGEFLEKLLYDCQTLEFMSVEYSQSLVDLKVAGPSLNLKSLSVTHCFAMKHLEISAPNLLSFVYLGPKLSSPFKSIPRLAKLSISGGYGNHLISNFLDLSCCISQVEVLTLRPTFLHKRMKKVFPECTRLKMLNVTVYPESDKQLFGIRSLINSCPFLQKFVLKLRFSAIKLSERTIRTRNVEACPHDHLKMVEIVGFIGLKVDTAFAMYLIENVISLEKMIIELSKIPNNWESMDKRTTRASKEAGRGTVFKSEAWDRA